ncbi:MAG: PBP1A family penicillin-binding protein [Acidobacteria bacterium]|nr:PBP1A family penicillin-binding protein [Acidobacteriota bacterium]
MRVVIRRGGWLRRPFRSLRFAGLMVALLFLIGGASVFTYYYVQFSHLIDQRLQGPVFPNVSQIYAAPEELALGQKVSAADVVSHLRLAGYSQRPGNPRGWYEWLADGIRVLPGPNSYFAQESAELHFSEGRLSSIVSLKDLYARREYALEPLLLTNLFDRTREKRRLVSFNDLPPHLVNAILAIEDRRFFQHSGVDYLRILKAAYVDIRAGQARQGASTITMQLARSLFLTPVRTLRRKLAETLVALQLERRLTKEQIFEYYCNKIYMGQRGSFSISGMGEATQAYFRKDVRSLTLAESAFLSGIIRGPNIYSPYRNPEAAQKRRNQVLNAMVETGAITQEQRDEVAPIPVEAAPVYTVASEAPYFVDMVKDQLLETYSEEELTSQSYQVYTTLDLKLQRAAAEAVRIGLEEVDERLQALEKPRRKRVGNDTDESSGPLVEVALIALDPHTGGVKALMGGRNYGQSQLNRVLARRQPGSAFKPLVYAAALSSALYPTTGPPWTPASKLRDEPATFVFDGGIYEPANYGDEYYGSVTLRYALMRSLNVATVKLAQMVGYEKVVALARRAGMNLRIQPTPAVALGAYEATPLEIAQAYTIFANQGVRMDPYLISAVRDRGGYLLEQAKPRATRVLDPRVAFVMTNLMEDVINHGTGAGVRGRGFTAPAAGKTGTSHDGWFAGYTSRLLTVVWVGYDSNRELPLSGASSALPIWTEFMKRAIAVPPYSDVEAPTPPWGVVQAEIDPETNELATPHCPRTTTEYFVGGTEPTEHCHLHYLQPVPQIPSLAPVAKIAPLPAAEPAVQQPPPVVVPAATAPAPVSPPPVAEKPKPQKRGFFGRIFGIFGGGSKNSD